MRILFLISAATFLPSAWSCMPGYEAEREKLREYLGIEWVPNGLLKTAFSSRPVRHANALNCDFNDVSKCQWTNMEDRHQLDSIDFYLFEKIDHTEFPPFRVAPGPTRVRQGEKFIFTGDKRREEQHAILFSSPIGCQNSTGNLTFTYWIYNAARVEVVLIEDDKKTGGYKLAYDKPYVDCGTVLLNTECHAQIPPRDTPFRIGIRAHDMATREGSFVMVDNIFYSASLCKVSVDLGDEFASFSMLTASEGKPIEAAGQLDCDSFDQRCRWRSGGESSTLWKRSRSQLPREFIVNITGNDIGPTGSYAILYVEQDIKQKVDVLRSDPITCQSLTENELSFRFWHTRELTLEACAVDLMGVDIECQPVPAGSSPAPAMVTFHRAAKNFYIAIRVSRFNPAFDNVVIVDDIKYRATLCTDALSVFDLGERFVQTPMLSVLINRHINSAKELSCDFERRASGCVWGPAEAEETDNELATASWQIGHGPVNAEKFFSLTTSRQLPNGDFAVARFETGGSAMMLSEVIRCVLEGNSSIQFDLWYTGTATLQVCLVDEALPSLLDCQPAQTGRVIVDLPQIERPFRVGLRALAEDQGMAMVDNLEVRGELCPALIRQFSSKSFRPAADQPDTNVCRLLSCDFSHGHACLYDSPSMPKFALFKVLNNKLLMKLNHRRPVGLIESPTFRLNAVARLHFTYEIIGDIILYVCNDGANKELENCYKVEKSQEDYIEVVPSDTKVYFSVKLADGGQRGQLSITKLQLTDVYDNEVC